MSVDTLQEQTIYNVRERTFEGWAIVDVLGHQRHVGYVTTLYFGQSAFFRVTTPQREPRERVLDGNEYVNFNACPYPPKGSTVVEDGRPAGDRMIGAGSVYALTPSTKDEVMKLLEEVDPRPVLSARNAEGKPITSRDDLPF